MANYEQALSKILQNEGGYINDQDDTGGETYRGVSRKNWSKWQGWTNIDLLKLQPGFPANLERDQELQSLVFDFYESNFWNRIKGDSILSQEIADSIFDFAINAGVGTSASLAQLVVGVKPDGIIGNMSLEAINAFDTDHFIASFTVAKIARYISIVKKRPVAKKYFYGWVCRALNS